MSDNTVDIRHLRNASRPAPVRDVTPVADVTPSSGGVLLDDIRALIDTYVDLPDEHCSVVMALWVVHTYLLGHLDHTPRLAFMSPEPGSGKSRALEVLELLCHRSHMSMSISSAALCRMVSNEQTRPTVLIDEIDAVFSPKSAGNNEDLRAVLNAGYRAGQKVTRVADPAANTLNTFDTFAAVALAGLNTLPDTVATRSIIVPMRRRLTGSDGQPFRRRRVEPEAERLRERILDALQDVDAVALPTDLDRLGIRDRDADVWEPLIAVADVLDPPRWGRLAREAASAFISGREPALTAGTRLLVDVREVFDQLGCAQLATSDLLFHLCQMDEAPWGADGRFSQLTAQRLAQLLKPYGIRPVQMRRPDQPNARGYRRVDFEDAWLRYLPARS